MSRASLWALFLTVCAVLLAGSSQIAAAKTLCVNKSGSNGCYTTIGAAVAAASAWDVINVSPGTYTEDVIIGMPLSLIGSGAGNTIIDATGLANGVFVDGFDNAGLAHVTVAGFTVMNAQWEGILVVSASDVTIRDNRIVNNTQAPAIFTGELHGCSGQPSFETDETGDCGGGLHLIGVWESIVKGNLISQNDDGILVSDETAATHDILIKGNTVKDNPGECGVVLASHPPVGATAPPFAAHYGIWHITVSDNDVENNGVQVGGAGVGMFSDGAGQGQVSQNVISYNRLIGNGIGGVDLHTHVGPNFFLPADNMDGNQIIGNFISKNLADEFDTATGGTVGININSGGGGSPVNGTIITGNFIINEDIDVAVNTPAWVTVHLNQLLGGKVGVANVCTLDDPSCKGGAIATQNFWGCAAGPSGTGCSTTSGPNIVTDPWLTNASATADQ